MNQSILIETIEELIFMGRIEDALGKLRDLFGKENRYKEVFIYSSRFRINEQNYRLGILSLADYQVELNSITIALISLCSTAKSNLFIEIDNLEPFSIEQNFKEFGNIKTKMLPIFPYKKDKPLKIENVLFDYHLNEIYDKSNHPHFYKEIESHILRKATIYNEAKPSLLDYNITFSEEQKEYFIEMELGICGYVDFLSVSRNLDVVFIEGGLKTTIRKKLQDKDIDKDPINPLNNVPKQLGVSSIVLTSDNYIVLQKRQKSEVASKMFHVSIAEGLQAYPSYDDYLKINDSQKNYKITDKTLSLALYRGLEEELGLENRDIKELELLSIYFDYELQQPIFQTCSYLNITSKELEKYYSSYKGRDTLSEIKRLDFIPYNIDKILLYFYQTSQEGVWSSHAVINIISFIEKHFGAIHTVNKVINKYFIKPKEFYLGEQNYVEIIRKMP
jgi:Effector-associated domain 11